jgi:hypothetical protein
LAQHGKNLLWYICTPNSGNAAAKLDRAKLLAASALAACNGYYGLFQNVSFELQLQFHLSLSWHHSWENALSAFFFSLDKGKLSGVPLPSFLCQK